MELTSLLPVAQSLEIKFPDGEATGIIFKLVSVDSPSARAIQRRIAQQTLENGKQLNVEELEKLNIELVVACIVDWSGLEEDGKPLSFSPTKATELLSKPELTFVREQVEQFILVRRNFFRRGTSQA